MVCIHKKDKVCDSSIPASLGAGVAPCLADGPACRTSIAICAIYSPCSEDWQVDEERARRAGALLSLVKLTSDCLCAGASSSLSSTITS